MATSFKFEGGLELERALLELNSVATSKNVGRRAIRKAAEPILEAYKAGTVVKTGALVRSETYGTQLNRRQTRLNRADKSPVETHIGTNDPAGVQEEFGNRHQAAAPALIPAWEAQGGERAIKRIGDSLWDEIGKAAARRARKAAKLKV